MLDYLVWWVLVQVLLIFIRLACYVFYNLINLTIRVMFLLHSVVVDSAVHQAWFYQNALATTSTYQQQIFNLAFQNQLFQNQVQQNQRNLEQAHAERDRLARENEALKRNSQSSETQHKRHYRKRRKNLEKHLGCSIQGCKARFSSDMAFRNHQRKRHNIRKRVPQEFQ